MGWSTPCWRRRSCASGSRWRWRCWHLRVAASRCPSGAEYLRAYFDELLEISGDRVGGVDHSIRCGFGRRNGRTIALVSQSGDQTTAAGYRTAARLVELADRLQIPILTLIDSPGADGSAAGEAAGVGTAIAMLLRSIADVTVPILSVAIGQGGSGGSLALAAPDNLWMTADGYQRFVTSSARLQGRERTAGRGGTGTALPTHLASPPIGGAVPSPAARRSAGRASTSPPRPPTGTTSTAPAPRPHPAHPRRHTQPIRTTPTTNLDAVELTPLPRKPPDPPGLCSATPTPCGSPQRRGSHAPCRPAHPTVTCTQAGDHAHATATTSSGHALAAGSPGRTTIAVNPTKHR